MNLAADRISAQCHSGPSLCPLFSSNSASSEPFLLSTFSPFFYLCLGLYHQVILLSALSHTRAHTHTHSLCISIHLRSPNLPCAFSLSPFRPWLPLIPWFRR